jgi:CRISPR-associated Csx2 family protein
MGQTQVKLITVLGTGNYSETEYQLDHREPVKTCFFPVAVAKWFEPNEIYVLLTEQARNHKNWRGCKEELAQFMSEENIHEVSIPEGKSEAELWQIFDAITKVVQEGDAIVLDITHGFRSLPLLAVLSVAYLRQVCGVSQVRILYGAFEARNPQDNSTPVFDLTPFVSLLDWLTAAKMFMETGDGRELARLIRTIPDLPQQQDDISTHLENLYTYLMLNRAQSIPDSLRQFTQSVEAISSTNLSGQAKPLAAILQHIIDTYKDINNPDKSESEIQLILWYYERKHMLQAATLAAEFLINLVIRATKEDRLCREHARTEVSRNIERFLDKKKSPSENDKDLKEVRDFLERFAGAHPDVYEKYRSAWKEVREVRNDLSHCGYRERFADPDEVIEKLNTHFANLREIHDAIKNMQS